MSKQDTTRGGIHIGSAGKNVSIKAGGDVVAGDKLITTMPHFGFVTAEQRQLFQDQLVQIEQALHGVKGHVEASRELGSDQSKEIATEVEQQLQLLNEVRQLSAALAPGERPPVSVVQRVEAGLAGATGLIEKVQAMAVIGSELAETLAGIVSRFLPLLWSARSLFGLS